MAGSTSRVDCGDRISKRKLLMVTTVAGTLRAFLVPFAAYYRSRGWRVDAIAAGAPSCQACIHAFDNVFDASWSRSATDIDSIIRAALQIKALVAREAYDVIHVHTPIAAMVTRMSLRLRNSSPKIVYTAHGFHFYQGAPVLKNLTFAALEKLAGHWTDALVVINREDEEIARKHSIVSKDRLFYMPGIGIDITRYSTEALVKGSSEVLRKELLIGNDATVFLQVGDFIKRKRYQDLLRAFATVPPPAVLVMAGDGPELGVMKSVATSLNLNERVRFLGYREDIAELMNLSNVVVLVSSQEGLPRAILEAMAMGRPVIGSCVRGTRDLIGSGAGILVPLGNVCEIGRAMRQLASDPSIAKRMGARGRELIGQYSIDRIIELHDQLYSTVLGVVL